MNISIKHTIKVILELFFIYSFTGGVYLAIETLYRGYSFMGMYYLAGVIGIMAYFINNTIMSYKTDFTIQVIVMTIIGTFLEGLYGNLFNMDYITWDYRNLPLSFWNDQINIIFIFAWALIMTFTIPILDYIDYKIFNGEKPYYMIFGRRKEINL